MLKRGNLKERDHLESLSVDGRKILKWVLKEENEWARNRLIWLRTGRRDVFLWNGTKPQGYKKKVVNSSLAGVC
jgi:hypothetical protein